MTDWYGIQRGSLDVSTDLHSGLSAINTRFNVDGEMRRRRGMARTNIIKKGSGVKAISGFSAFQSNVMASLVDGTNMQGYQQPAALWGDNPDYTPIEPPDIPRPLDGWTMNGLLDNVYGGTSTTVLAGDYSFAPLTEGLGVASPSVELSSPMSDYSDYGQNASIAVRLLRSDEGSGVSVQMGGYTIYMFGNIVGVMINGYGTVAVVAPLGEFVVAITMDGLDRRLYVDGDFASALPESTGEAFVGIVMRLYANGSVVGDILAWDQTLTPEQVAAVSSLDRFTV